MKHLPHACFAAMSILIAQQLCYISLVQAASKNVPTTITTLQQACSAYPEAYILFSALYKHYAMPVI